MSASTPGPWAATKPNANGEVFIKDTRVPPQLITSAVQSDREHGATANAKLIATAPALYEQLEHLAERYQEVVHGFMALIGWTNHEEWPEAFKGLRADLEMAHDVLAKARGDS